MKKISKEEMDELTKRIDDEFQTFIKEGKYKDVLLSMGNLGKYSMNNQLYIIVQFPQAKTVNGLRKWNSFGRYVRKGEKAIRIFKPIVGKNEKEEGSDSEKRILKGFQTGYVFDISQTEGEEVNVFKFNEEQIISNKNEILASLGKIADTYGYKIINCDLSRFDEDCYGLCNHNKHEIMIRSSLGDLQEISTTIHELGHALAHSKPREDFEGLSPKEKREIKEVEAESIACIVCSYLGLDTKNFNFSYISAWAEGDIRKFRKNMDTISKFANLIIEGIEEGVEMA